MHAVYGQGMDITPFIMVLLGCGTDVACEPVATLPVAYESRESCMASRSEILGALDDRSMIAECRRQGSLTPTDASAAPAA